MVKNYQGERISPQKGGDNQPISVGDHMAKQVVTFLPDQSLSEVVDTLLEHGYAGAPVINERNELVGMISEGDCIKELVNEKYYNQPSNHGRVKDFMVTEVIHISPDISVFEAARMFLDLRLRRFPVLDQRGKLVGQISQKDVIRAIRNLKSNTWHHPES